MLFDKHIKVVEELGETKDKLAVREDQLKKLGALCKQAFVFDTSDGLDRRFLEEIYGRIQQYLKEE